MPALPFRFLARGRLRPEDAGPVVSRRVLLGGAVAGAGLVVTSACGGGDERRPGRRSPDAGLLEEGGLLALPEGFGYTVLAREGETRLETGQVSPSDPDGLGVFVRRDGPGLVLVCNHEVGGEEAYPVPRVEGLVYDPAANGGTTTFVLDEDGTVVRHYVSLAGTHNNCAGGPTPWETWLTCEETEDIRERRHGYVFEVDPHDEAANRDPRPITALGRFPHEAVAVDPDEDVLYLSEDANGPHGSLYRWTPPAEARPLGPGRLRTLDDDAGVLAALRATDEAGDHVPDLSVATQIGTTFAVAWVEVPDRDATEVSVRRQFDDDEITRSRKLEGLWWGEGGVYVVSSYARHDDGSAQEHDGQVWFLDPAEETLTLRLRFGLADDVDTEPDGPDNISVSPHGGVVIAENGAGLVHLIAADDDGEPYYLAGSVGDAEGEEFCGPVFSPDGRALFANLQGTGTTFLIEGPFANLP